MEILIEFSEIQLLITSIVGKSPKVGCNRFPNPSQKTKMRGCFLKSKFRLKGLMAATFLYTLNLYRNTEDSECI